MTLPTTDDRTLRTSDTAEEMWDLVDGGDPAEARQTYPSGWLWLTGAESVRELLDSLLDADPDARYGVEDLASRSGLSDDAVEDAVDALISLGVLVADEGTYRIDERAIVRHAAQELSAAVEATDAPDEATGFEYLAQYESVRLMIDALVEVDPGRELTQEDLHRLSGVSRKRVWHHVEKLVALSVVEESGDEYVVVPESSVLRSVQSLDAAVVGAALAPSHP
jgi:DNA-binding IclR family transcriptional regulator